MVNLNLEDQKYLFVLIRLKKKINIVKIRTNSHNLHSETRDLTIPRRAWDEGIFYYAERHSTTQYGGGLVT